jgi:ribonucleoside-diphosphate reductase alpha chain
MGFHELLIKTGIAYDSPEGVEKAEEVMSFINQTAHQYSQELAQEKGSFPGIDESDYEVPHRNATLTTIAPTGSISFLGGTSGGIEPFFSFKYSHTDADGNVSQFEYDFTEDAPEEVLVTAMDIAPEWHVKIQAAFQAHVDNAVSKTINFPNGASRDDVAQAYKSAYELGCKGLTVYRDGSRTSQVLSTDDEAEQEQELLEQPSEIEGEIYPEKRPLAAAGETIKYDTGCGKLYLTINLNDEGEPIETFLTTGSGGGCVVMTEAVSRLTSLALRSGIATEKIIDQLESTATCPSFMYEKGQGNQLQGRSCPDVVARALTEIVESKTFQHLKSDLEVIEQEKEKNKQQEELQNQDQADKPLCPECGEELHFEEGCDSCNNCGYSHCG